MTINDLFSDIEFQKLLIEGIRAIEDAKGVLGEGSKSNGYRSLKLKGLLDIESIKYHWAMIMAKESRLSSSERSCMDVLVRDAMNKRFKQKQ